MNPKSQILQKFVEIRDKRCEKNLDLTRPFGLLSHFTKLHPNFPFLCSFKVNRFSGAMHGHSVHRVIGTGPYTGHRGLEADKKLDISPERKKKRNSCSVQGRSRGITREEEAQEDGESNRASTGCFVPLAVRWRFDNLVHCILQFEYLQHLVSLTCGGHV
jgi:hypothetical protein